MIKYNTVDKIYQLRRLLAHTETASDSLQESPNTKVIELSSFRKQGERAA